MAQTRAQMMPYCLVHTLALVAVLRIINKVAEQQSQTLLSKYNHNSNLIRISNTT